MPTFTEVITVAVDFVADYQILIAASVVLALAAGLLRRATGRGG